MAMLSSTAGRAAAAVRREEEQEEGACLVAARATRGQRAPRSTAIDAAVSTYDPRGANHH